ncbi:MAG TPA: diguanylate cyclase [Burkholderiaceae bacterium]
MALFSKKKLDELVARELSNEPRQTVLIVDDEEANRNVMANILGPYFNLLQATDGQDALRVIDGLGPSAQLACIVSDQRMPNLTGIELFQRVQKLLPLTVRIIVTGYVDVDSIVDSINNAEIYKFIVKPFDVNDFLLTVRRGVESYELHRQLSEYHRDLAEQVRVRTRELEESQAQLIESNRVLRAEVLERQRAEATLKKTSEQILALYNNASCGYHSIDRDGLILQMNDTELKWLGRRREEVVGKMRWPDLITPQSWKAFLDKYPQVVENGWVYDLHDIEFELMAASGNPVPVLLNAVAVEDGGAMISRFTVFDITERNQAHEHMRYMASHDALTGLANRSLLIDRLRRDIALAHRNRRQVGLLFIDLDRFKQINDTLGHHVGDQLLQQVARRLEECVRKSDSVARLGGDEFVVSLAELADQSDAGNVAEKILQTLARDFLIDQHVLQISGSIGISIYPDDGSDVEALMRQADAAMYRAKEQGRNQYRLYAKLYL